MFFEILFLFFGILLIVSATANIFRKAQIKRRSIPVSAVVIDIHRTSKAGKNKSRTQYHPVFEYHINNRTLKARGPGALEVKYPIGTVLEIRCDTRRPERILISESVTEGQIAPILIGVTLTIGSILSMVGIKLPKLDSSTGYLLFAGMLLLFVIIISAIIKSLKSAGKSIKQHILSGQTANNVLVVAKNANNTITFQFINGNLINYIVPEPVFNSLQAGDWGNLTFQGSLFIRFEKTYRYSAK